MKFIPILFSTPMVQAIRAGKKTQTRRVVKHHKVNVIDPPFAPDWDYVRFYDGFAKFCEVHFHSNETYVKCPYGQPGDVLWVREKVCNTDTKENPYWLYAADGCSPRDTTKKWTPSIHMPKKACRIFLEVESIRVERLWDISEQDAIAEGVETLGLYPGYNVSSKGKFEGLWYNINGPDSWDANPWVWVIAFKQIDKPTNFLP